MIKKLVILVAALTACAAPEPGTDQTPDSAATTSPETGPADPDSAAVQRFRASMPDSVLARANACPFECCVYGTWVAEAQTPMYGSPRSSGTPAFTIAAGDSMRADSGVVYVTSVALVAVTDTVLMGQERRVAMVPGDTLVLLDPIGEGYWTGWLRGQILREVPPFWESWSREPGDGRLIGKPAREWWVRATVRGRTGWFRADQYRVRGADACA